MNLFPFPRTSFAMKRLLLASALLTAASLHAEDWTLPNRRSNGPKPVVASPPTRSANARTRSAASATSSMQNEMTRSPSSSARWTICATTMTARCMIGAAAKDRGQERRRAFATARAWIGVHHALAAFIEVSHQSSRIMSSGIAVVGEPPPLRNA